jgi:hypothetical protein
MSKFQVGDRIVDEDPYFNTGTIVDVFNRHEETLYEVKYDNRNVNTTNCPEHEMKLLTKLHKVLK